MRSRAVIEIIPDLDGQLPAQLIMEAYRASRRGTIIFILRDVTPSAVDLILDDLVPNMSLSLPGVEYVDADNELSVLEAILSAEVIFAATARFRDFIANSKVCCAVWSVSDAMEAFTSREGSHSRMNSALLKPAILQKT